MSFFDFQLQPNFNFAAMWTRYMPSFDFAPLFDSFCGNSWNSNSWDSFITSSMNFSNNFMPQVGYNDMSLFNFNSAPSFDTWMNFNNTANFDSFTKSSVKTTNKNSLDKYQTRTGGYHSYCYLSRSEAIRKAEKDSNLEELTGGNGWSIASNCFKNDIPYAKTGTGALLDKVYNMTGIKFQITSALGTKSSPHVKSKSYCSHYNPNNPKLDIQTKDCSASSVKKLRTKLLATGLFEFANVEVHGNTAHIDCQFKESAYQTV